MAEAPGDRLLERARAPHPGTGPEPAGAAERSATHYARISILAALATIALKGGAYGITGSVGLLSDALESLVNLAAAVVALLALSVAARPADEEHAYGHTKAEYFSSGFEGALIVAAALGILWAAVGRLLDPRPLEDVGVGVTISLVASGINFGVARVLIRAGRRQGSIALEADAHHLMTDVWTSLGVSTGVGAAALTGWEWLDPVLAIAVGVNITGIGAGLIRRSLLGLLDTALPGEMQEAISGVLAGYVDRGVQFHALRTRRAGRRRFISFHVLVPADWTVGRGHDLLEEIEDGIRAAVPGSTVFTHLEPVEDPRSWADIQLDRVRGDGSCAPMAGGRPHRDDVAAG